MFSNAHPYLAFLLGIIASLCVLIFSVYAIFVIYALIARVCEIIIFRKMRNAVRRNPGIGLKVKDKDGSFLLKRGSFTFAYTLERPSDGSGQNNIKQITIKRRLSSYERRLRIFINHIRQLRLSDSLISILQPRTLLPLLVIMAFSYFAFFEPQPYKDKRAAWMVAKALNINSKDVKVQPNGMIAISTNRESAFGGGTVTLSLNPPNLVTHTRTGYVTVSRKTEDGRGDQYVQGLVTVDDNGNINVRKGNRMIAGKYTENEIIWNEPIPTGVPGQYIRGHDIVRSGNSIVMIKDK